MNHSEGTKSKLVTGYVASALHLKNNKKLDASKTLRLTFEKDDINTETTETEDSSNESDEETYWIMHENEKALYYKWKEAEEIKPPFSEQLQRRTRLRACSDDTTWKNVSKSGTTGHMTRKNRKQIPKNRKELLAHRMRNMKQFNSAGSPTEIQAIPRQIPKLVRPSLRSQLSDYAIPTKAGIRVKPRRRAASLLGIVPDDQGIVVCPGSPRSTRQITSVATIFTDTTTSQVDSKRNHPAEPTTSEQTKSC